MQLFNMKCQNEFEDTKRGRQKSWQDHGQQNETKNKNRTQNTTLKTKVGFTQTLQK